MLNKLTLDDNWTTYNTLTYGTIPIPGGLAYNIPYNLKLEYDGNKTFTFWVAGQSAVFVGPDRQRDAQGLPGGGPFKNLTTRVLSDSATGKGYISAWFSDIKSNGVAHDDLTNPDPSKWLDALRVREVRDDKLRLAAAFCNSSPTNYTYVDEYLLIPEGIDNRYFEAKVLFDGASSVEYDAGAYTRLRGFLYNVERGPGSGLDYDGAKGNIWVSVRLIKLRNNTGLVADANVWECGSADCWTGTSHFYQTFTTPISQNGEYVLSWYFDGSKITFKCNGEMAEWLLPPEHATRYPPSAKETGLQSRVFANPGQCGNISGTFDDVYIWAPGRAVEPVPTLNEWGLIALSVLILVSGFWAIRRRRLAA